MPNIDVLTISGRKSKKMSLPSEIFSAKINPILMVQAIRVYLSNQRQAPAQTKRRGQIHLAGSKIYKQKGTGRARHGDRRPGIFVKGAKAHGPTGGQNFKLKMSKKLKKQALFSALTSKLKDKEVMIVSGLDKIEPKTKKLASIFQKLKLEKKTTLVLPLVLENLIRAGRNISNLELRQARLLNVYQILNGGQLVFLPESISVLKEHFLVKNKNKKKKKAKNKR